MWPRLCLSFLLLSAVAISAMDISNVRIQACGSNLASTVRLVCNSVYNSRLAKKSQRGVFMVDDSVLLSLLDQQQDRGSVYNTYPLALPSMLTRQRRGIVEECCHKPCSVSEWRQYCG
uniref:Insulin-like peptide 2 n=1 Tax=Carausius morosus TaxID=7022 RepID=A0A6G4ZUT5_CARMO|nr:insulin-like protein 2 [Carausius morosus]